MIMHIVVSSRDFPECSFFANLGSYGCLPEEKKMSIRRIVMGGGVPGTSAFPYYSGSCIPMSEQSDWALYSILVNWVPKNAEDYSREIKESAAKEWLERHPSKLSLSGNKRWAVCVHEIAQGLLASK